VGRVAAFIGLNIIGALIGVWGLSSVFAGFAVVAAFGSVIAALFITETRFRTLEEISP
jgi:MFS transporter, putative metabolite:H+ symporter